MHPDIYINTCIHKPFCGDLLSLTFSTCPLGVRIPQSGVGHGSVRGSGGHRGSQQHAARPSGHPGPTGKNVTAPNAFRGDTT